MRKHFSLLECINYYHLYSLSNCEVCAGSRKNSSTVIFAFMASCNDSIKKSANWKAVYVNKVFDTKRKTETFTTFYSHRSFLPSVLQLNWIELKRSSYGKSEKAENWKIQCCCLLYFKYSFYECLLPHPFCFSSHFSYTAILSDVLVSHYDFNIWLIDMYREHCRFGELISN